MTVEVRAAARWRQLRGEVTSRAIPLRTVQALEGGPVSISRYRDRRQVAIFLAHDGRCVECDTFETGLVRVAPSLGDAEAITEAIVVRSSLHPDRPSGLARWLDPGDGWRTRIAERLGFASNDAALVLTDRYLAPRILSSSADAAGLIATEDLLDWARYLALDCPECTTALDWGD